MLRAISWFMPPAACYCDSKTLWFKLGEGRAYGLGSVQFGHPSENRVAGWHAGKGNKPAALGNFPRPGGRAVLLTIAQYLGWQGPALCSSRRIGSRAIKPQESLSLIFFFKNKFLKSIEETLVNHIISFSVVQHYNLISVHSMYAHHQKSSFLPLAYI